MWDEKPLLVKTMDDPCMLWSSGTSEGDTVIAAAAAMPWGWPEAQQSMGQLAGDSTL